MAFKQFPRGDEWKSCTWLAVLWELCYLGTLSLWDSLGAYDADGDSQVWLINPTAKINCSVAVFKEYKVALESFDCI